jgi:hypothetical protein
MLSLPLPVRVYLCLEPTDMRRSFDGLCRMVREHVGADPCPLPRSGRILRRMLPNCLPIGGCLLHREFGKG